MKLWNIYEKSTMFREAKGGVMTRDSASLFVCGITVKEIFCPKLAFAQNSNYTMEEVWYMLCLHHEKRRIRIKQIFFTPLRCYKGNAVCFTNGACVEKALFSRSEIEDYYYFQKACCRKNYVDHGIAGGLLLYENLIARHALCKLEMNDAVLKMYSYIANTLIAHNMCRVSEKELQITPEKDPLLFLFVLAETIEPLQYRKKELESRELLNAVEVEISENKIVLQPDPEYFDFDAMERRIHEMQKIIKIGCMTERKTSKICINM